MATLVQCLTTLLPKQLVLWLKSVRDRRRFRKIGLVIRKYDGRLQRFGTEYGGYVVPLGELEPGDICYCFGAGEDVSLEIDLATAIPVQVHIFDPTPRAIEHVERLQIQAPAEVASRVHMHPWGAWSQDCAMQFFAPQDPSHVSHSILNMQKTNSSFIAECRRPDTMMRELDHIRVKLVKLNIEGAEYEVIRTLFEESIFPAAICINFDELHTHIDGKATERLRNLIEQFVEAGYIAVSAEQCRATFVRRPMDDSYDTLVLASHKESHTENARSS